MVAPSSPGVGKNVSRAPFSAQLDLFASLRDANNDSHPTTKNNGNNIRNNNTGNGNPFFLVKAACLWAYYSKNVGFRS